MKRGLRESLVKVFVIFWGEALAQVQSAVNHRNHTGHSVYVCLFSGRRHLQLGTEWDFDEVIRCLTVGTGINPAPLASLKALHSYVVVTVW